MKLDCLAADQEPRDSSLPTFPLRAVSAEAAVMEFVRRCCLVGCGSSTMVDRVVDAIGLLVAGILTKDQKHVLKFLFCKSQAGESDSMAVYVLTAPNELAAYVAAMFGTGAIRLNRGMHCGALRDGDDYVLSITPVLVTFGGTTVVWQAAATRLD